MEQATITDDAPAVELIDRAEIKDGKAIVAYSRTEAAIAELRQKYQGAKYDLTTTAGDKAARAARLELVTTRTALEKRRKELKAPAVEFGKRVDSEAARLTAEIVALEDPIDAQIKADEARREAERKAREEAEAARRKKHTDAIAKIAGYVAQATDLPSDRIASGVAYLEGLDLSGFEEFTTEATETRDRTVAALRALQIKAKAREDEAARLEAERAEQARIAAEQAQVARQLKAQQEELERQRAALAAEQEKVRQEQAAREEEERQQRAAAEEAERQAQAKCDGNHGGPRCAAAPGQCWHDDAPAAAPSLPTAAAGPAVIPLPTRAPAAAPEQPTLKLGDIQKRLAPLSIDAAGLAALGFPVVATDKSAKLYRESDWHGICAAIAQHVVGVANGRKAVA
jgi:vacuolar-type H+-ATPase subunit I/STV1